jgi:hypothetical protein
MASARTNFQTRRDVSLLCFLFGLVILAGCLVNPLGVYEPWALTFGIVTVLAIASALSAVYYHFRLTASEN